MYTKMHDSQMNRSASDTWSSWNGVFTRRFKTWMSDEWKSLSTAVDWVIALYFVVPGLIALGIIYTAWWRQAPEWLALLPVEGMLLGLFLFALFFKLRTFLEPADQIFLVRHRTAIPTIRRLGLVYSLTIATLSTVGLLLLLCPLLVRGYELTFGQVASLTIVTLAWKLALPLLLEITRIRFAGWRSYVLQAGFIITGGLVFLFTSRFMLITHSNDRFIAGFCLISAVSAAYLITRYRMRMRGTLLYEIEQERRARMKLTAFLLARSGVKEEKAVLDKRRPLILRRSQSLTRHRDKSSALIEAVIKSYIRSPDQWLFLAHYTAVSVVALTLTPGWWGGLVYAGLVYLLYQGIRSYCTIAVNSSYLDLFHWSKDERLSALFKAIWRISLPVSAILLLVLLLTR